MIYFFHQKGKKSHYSLIQNFNKLYDSQVTKNTNCKEYFWKRCLSYYLKPELLQRHIKFCSSNKELAIPIMPKPNTEIEYRNLKRELKLPFVFYADFESFLIPIDKCDPNPKESFFC